MNRGRANAVLLKARECGATEGTIFLGEGTVQSVFLELLGVNEVHKEIVMIPASAELSDKLHEAISADFQLSKRNKGIAFSIPFKKRKLHVSDQDRQIKKVNPRFFCIMVIVDKEWTKHCIYAARAAGAKGGTLIHGHGAGIPAEFYFPVVLEPQKDLIFIIASKNKVSSIRKKISTDLRLGQTGRGIIFTLPVTRTSGLVENRTRERMGVKT